ncbi:MAG: DMT family transporter [Acidobacteriaceae bacterium]
MDANPAVPRARCIVGLAALGVIWGTTWVATDTLSEYMPPLRGEAMRFLLAALVSTPVILIRRVPLPRGRALGFVLLLSATMLCLPSLLLLWSRQHASSVTVTVLFAAMPLLVAALASAPSAAMQAAMVGLGAVALALSASFSLSQAAGAAVALVAVTSTGASALLVRRELRNASPLAVTSTLLGAAGMLLFLASLVLERGHPIAWNPAAIAAIGFLALVAGVPAYVLYIWLLQNMEAYKVVTVQWIQILVALAEAAFFLRAGWSISMIAGSVVTLTCLLVVMRVRLDDDNTVSLIPNS